MSAVTHPMQDGYEHSTDCCAPGDSRVVREFDRRASASAAGDEFPEMVAVSGAVLDRLRDASLDRPSVLELGCGTGALAVALLEMGARRLSGVDVSPASVEVARRRADAAGLGAQASFVVGNAASLHLEPHDWVLMDRVICCDAHVDALLDAALGAARSRIVLSVPESRGWRGLLNRPMWTVEAAWDRLTGGCPGYVHSVRRMVRRLREAGFSEVPGRRYAGLWYVGVFERIPTE